MRSMGGPSLIDERAVPAGGGDLGILGPPWQNACSGPKGPEHLTAIA
jgi:hypothetical protein